MNNKMKFQTKLKNWLLFKDMSGGSCLENRKYSCEENMQEFWNVDERWEMENNSQQAEYHMCTPPN